MHLDEGTIHAWLDGALDADEAARVERHAAECEACAAAVAEARGLVAGASRILTALDGVPGGIVPKPATSGNESRARRTRSLWATLHLTPVRAAAAAVIVIAAGTALVVRSAPNAARSAITLADYPRDSAVSVRTAAPRTVPLAATVGATSASRTMATKAASKPSSASRRRADVGAGAVERAGAVAVGEQAKPVVAQQLAASDSTRRETSADSIAKRTESAAARSAVADNAVRGAVAGAAGAAPRPAAAPPSVASRRYAAKLLTEARSTVGCYAVTTDSAISLPPRLRLDSSLVAVPAMLQRSMDRHGVSEIVNDAPRSITGAYWAPRGDGSIQLSLPAASLQVDLVPTSASTLVGTAVIGDRSASVTLRRVECGTR